MRSIVRLAATSLLGATLFSSIAAIPAAATPALDPDNNGTMTPAEVFTAPLVPAGYLPDRDADGDGALSIAEAVRGGDSFVAPTGEEITFSGEPIRFGETKSVRGPADSLWSISVTKAALVQWGQYVINVRRIDKGLRFEDFRFTFEDATGDQYQLQSFINVHDRTQEIGYYSSDPTIVKVIIRH